MQGSSAPAPDPDHPPTAAPQAGVAPNDELLSAGGAVRVFAVFAVAYLLSALVRAVTATLAPTLTADLGLTPGNLGLLAGAYFLGFSLTQLPLGRWLDRFGPRRVLIAFLAVAVAGCVAFAAARSFASLTVARALIGAGVSACLMAPLTGFSRWYSLAAQLRANSWMLMAGSSGMVASTLPVQWLLPVTGWRGLFLVLAALFLVCIVAVIAWIPRDRPAPQVTTDTPVDGGYREIWRHPVFRRYLGLGFVNYGGMIALQTLWIGPWLVTVSGWSPQSSAAGLFVVNTAMLLTFLSWGLLMPRLLRAGWTVDRLVAWGTPVSLAVLVMNLALGAQATAWAWAIFCTSSTFLSLAQPRVGQAFGPHQAGRALSAYNLVIFAGVFAMQWGIGLAIDALQALQIDRATAHRGAMALYAAACVVAYLDHLRCLRRHTADEVSTAVQQLSR